jgi:hypothetical protein
VIADVQPIDAIFHGGAYYLEQSLAG